MFVLRPLTEGASEAVMAIALSSAGRASERADLNTSSDAVSGMLVTRYMRERAIWEDDFDVTGRRGRWLVEESKIYTYIGEKVFGYGPVAWFIQISPHVLCRGSLLRFA